MPKNSNDASRRDKDRMENWMKPTIHRMGKKIGITRMATYVDQLFCVDVEWHLTEIIRVAFEAATAANRKTIQPEDVLLTINKFNGLTESYDESFIAKAPFRRAVLSYAYKYWGDLRISSKALDIMRKFSETRIFTLLRMSYRVMKNDKRRTLMQKDVRVVIHNSQRCTINTGVYDYIYEYDDLSE